MLHEEAPLIFYEVTARPEPGVRAAYESYMRQKHVADVLATGCFTGARLAGSADGLYRTTYIAATREDLDRYLDGHAQRLRDDFSAHFPAGIALSREVLEVLREW